LVGIPVQPIFDRLVAHLVLLTHVGRELFFRRCLLGRNDDPVEDAKQDLAVLRWVITNDVTQFSSFERGIGRVLDRVADRRLAQYRRLVDVLPAEARSLP